MLTPCLTVFLAIAGGLGTPAISVQDQQVMVGIVIDGKERISFAPRPEPYTQGGPTASFPIRDGQARTKDGLIVRGFEFIGWKEGDGYRVFAFVIVPPKPGSNAGGERRLDFASMHVRVGEAVPFEKMKDVGLTPWTIRVRPKNSLAAPQAQTRDTLPQIGVKRTTELSPSYSCRPTTAFERGYQRTALFLSDEMKRRNSPDLLFNGACGSENYIQSSTHGGNYSLVADVSANAATSWLRSLTRLDPRKDRLALTKLGFGGEAAVVPGHTYAILLDKHGVRGLFVVTVTKHVKDTSVELTYEVLDYQVTDERAIARR